MKKGFFVLCLLLLGGILFLSNVGAEESDSSYSPKEIRSALFKAVNSVNGMPIGKYNQFEYTEDTSTLSDRIDLADKDIAKNILDIETKGATDGYSRNLDICSNKLKVIKEDGSIIFNKEDCTKVLGIPQNDLDKYVKLPITNISDTTGAQGFIISSHVATLLIFMQKESLYILEENLKNGNSKKASTAHALEALSFIVYASEIGSANMEFFNNRSFVNKSTATEKIKVLKQFSQDLKQPSEDEINSIDLVKPCLQAYKKGFDDIAGFEGFSESKKQNLWEKIKSLFVSKKGICNTLDNNIKKNAIMMRNDVSQSENILFVINTKLYLNALIKCSGAWPDISECAQDYLDEKLGNTKRSDMLEKFRDYKA